MLKWDELPAEARAFFEELWSSGPLKSELRAARTLLELGFVEAEQGWYYLTRAGVQFAIASGLEP